MKSRDVVGKKILAVRQGMIAYNGGRGNAVEAIVLEDGTELRFVTLELEGDYATEVVVAKPEKRKGKSSCTSS